MDLIKVEIEQLKHQVEILDAIFDDLTSKKQLSYCESLKIYIIEYYENVLHKFGYGNTKTE